MPGIANILQHLCRTNGGRSKGGQEKRVEFSHGLGGPARLEPYDCERRSVEIIHRTTLTHEFRIEENVEVTSGFSLGFVLKRWDDGLLNSARGNSGTID